MASELTFAGVGQEQPSGTNGINGYIETSDPNVEVFRVTTGTSGDYFYSRKFIKIKAALVQNHGAAFATGVSRDPPKLTIIQGDESTNTSARIIITHTATAECFSLILFGDM